MSNCASCGNPLVRRQKKFCSLSCINRDKTGTKGRNWKGGMTWQRDREVVMINGKYRLKYRVIMEKILGRPLSRVEFVHHIDGNPKNNHVDNLMVMTLSEHQRLHAKMQSNFRDEFGRFTKEKNHGNRTNSN